jgi:hypothetical protein
LILCVWRLGKPAHRSRDRRTPIMTSSWNFNSGRLTKD